MTLRSIARAVTPPAVLSGWRAIRARRSTLFDGHGQMFKELAIKTKVYGEYGCGLSTNWVLENTSALIISVDTAEYWAKTVAAGAKFPARLDLQWIDVGPVGDWGRPLGFERRNAFRDYIFAPWRREEQPDLILIDGRFRVACFFASLLRSSPGTLIVVDDYANRLSYHVVEELLRPTRYCGRQACFEVPDGLDPAAIQHFIEKFEYVVD